MEKTVKSSIDVSLKLETEKLLKIVKDMDEKLELVRIQFIKTKRNESNLQNE